MGIRRLARLTALCAVLYGVTLASVVAIDRFWPRDTLPAPADAIVCLGGSASATVLGADSLARAERCVDLFDAGRAPALIFTGHGAAPLMADVARTRGVPDAAIGVEARSRSTLQNALFTAQVMHPTPERVIVVSNAYHLPRSWIAFRVMGFQDIALSPSTSRTTRARPLAREALAIWFNAGRALVWLATPWLDADLREALLV